MWCLMTRQSYETYLRLNRLQRDAFYRITKDARRRNPHL